MIKMSEQDFLKWNRSPTKVYLLVCFVDEECRVINAFRFKGEADFRRDLLNKEMRRLKEPNIHYASLEIKYGE